MYRTVSRLIVKGLLITLMMASLGACVSQRSDGTPVNEEAALDSYVKLAMAYIDNGNRESARHHIGKALELDSRSTSANAALAMLYQLEGEPELAEERFKWVLRREPEASRARNNYAAFLYKEKRYEEAYKQFKKVSRDLDYDRRDRALLNLGRTALKLNKREEAKAALEHAYQLNRRMPAVLAELAEISFNEEDYARAKRYLDQYGEVSQQSARTLLLGIKIERIFGNKDKEASYALALKNRFPYSEEYLEYRSNYE